MLCFIHSLYNYFWHQCPHLEVTLNPITISLITYVTREQNITTSMLQLSDKTLQSNKNVQQNASNYTFYIKYGRLQTILFEVVHELI